MRLSVLALTLAVIGGCMDGPSALRNQCRANMNALASDMAMFRVTTGFWTDSPSALDSMAGRREGLVCPVCRSGYTITLHSGGYHLECPGAGHGHIDTGTPDWGHRER